MTGDVAALARARLPAGEADTAYREGLAMDRAAAVDYAMGDVR